MSICPNTHYHTLPVLIKIVTVVTVLTNHALITCSKVELKRHVFIPRHFYFYGFIFIVISEKIPDSS